MSVSSYGLTKLLGKMLAGITALHCCLNLPGVHVAAILSMSSTKVMLADQERQNNLSMISMTKAMFLE